MLISKRDLEEVLDAKLYRTSQYNICYAVPNDGDIERVKSMISTTLPVGLGLIVVTDLTNLPPSSPTILPIDMPVDDQSLPTEVAEALENLRQLAAKYGINVERWL